MCHHAQVLKCNQWFLTCSSQNKGPHFLKVKEVTTDFRGQKNSLNFLCTTDMKWTTLKIMFHCFLHSLTDYPSLIYIFIYLFISAFFLFFFLSFFLSLFIYLFIYLFIFMNLFIHLFIYLLVCLFVCLFVYLFIYLFIFFIFFYLLLTNYN